MSGDWRTGGLLAYSYSTPAARADLFVPLVGIGLTWLTLFFAASFRQMRTALHQSLPEGEEKQFLCNQPRAARLRQWPVFVLTFGFLNLAWLALVVRQSVDTAIVVGLLSVPVFIFLWIRGQ